MKGPSTECAPKAMLAKLATGREPHYVRGSLHHCSGWRGTGRRQRRQRALSRRRPRCRPDRQSALSQGQGLRRRDHRGRRRRAQGVRSRPFARAARLDQPRGRHSALWRTGCNGARRGEPPLRIAYVIPRKVFDAALVSAALLRGAADFTGFKLEKADRCDGRWSLELSGEPPGRPRRRITADFLIGADGGTSRVRRALGLALNSDAHTSIAIRAYARVTAPRKPLMQIDMINGIIWPGYAWIFDSGSQVVNVGLGTELVAYKAQKPRLPEVLASYLSQLGGDFDLYQASVHSAPLPRASRLPRLALPAQSAALIGDAASMINPLTGEGISYGMVAGLLLGRELAEAVRQGQDLVPAALRYEKDFRARFSAHFRNNVALRGILRFRPLAERMVGSYRRDAAYYRDALEFMLGCGNTISAPRLFWRGLVLS